MRKYLIDFLDKQKPGLIYIQKEQAGFFSWIWRVWLSQTDEVMSLFVVYTPISVMFTEQSSEVLLLGKEDNSFYGKLRRMIKVHSDYSEAIQQLTPDLSGFTACFQYSCDMFVTKVNGKKKTWEDCRLLHFDCVEARLGIFSILFEVAGSTEHCVLMMGRQNFISLENSEKILGFFDYLFEGKFILHSISGGIND